MRVLLWHWGRRGGGPRYSFELARALGRLPDVDLHISLSRQSQLFQASTALGFPGHHVDTYAGFAGLVGGLPRLLTMRRDFAAYVAGNRIDVVLCTMVHLWNAAIAGSIAGAGARYVLTVHDATLHPGERNLVRDFCNARDFRYATRLIALTQYVKQELVARQAAPQDRIDVIPHGVFDYAAPTATRPANSPLRLLFFGRILAYKGLDLLLRAMSLLRQLGTPVALTIAGQGSLAPYRTLLAEAGPVELIDRWIDEAEIGSLFARHDALVQPYVEASQSGVIPVAFASGLPAIVTPVGGLVEQVRHDVSGLVCSDTSPQAIAEQIRQLATDNALLARLGGGARAAAAGELSWATIAPRVRDSLAAALRA